ncbi:MAG: transporter [Akkermansiaceae bacterium]|nr:transporter [Akkermansiaceae bacterium]
MQDLRALPGQYWILFAGTLVNRMGSFVIPFLAIYLRQRGHGAGTISFTLGAYGAGSLGAGLIGGYLSDRFGRKPTMLISCGGAAACMLVLSQMSSVPGLVGMTFMTGMLTSMYGPAAGALIADLVPPVLRVRAFSCQRLAINLGFAIGMAIAGFMAKQSFMTLFVADAATTLVLGLTLLFGLKKRPSLVRSGAGWAPALRHMRGNRAFQLAVAASFLVTIVFWQMSSSYGLQATEGAGLDERTYGLLMALNGILIVAIELPITSVTRRYPAVRVIALGYAVLGLGMGLNAFGASLGMLTASMLVFTLGEIIASPVGNGYMAGLAPDEMRGRYQGVISMSFSAATMVGPSMGIAIYQLSPVAVWVGTLVLALVAAGLMLATGRERDTRLEDVRR